MVEYWEKLNSQVQLLRSVPYEQHKISGCLYGRVNGGGWRQFLSNLYDFNTPLSGPYKSRDHYIAALVATAEICLGQNCSKELSPTEQLFQNHFEFCLEGNNEAWRPTLTHYDLQPQNVIVRDTKSGEPEVIIIDWQNFGWFPAWVEGASLLTASEVFKHSDIFQWLGGALEPADLPLLSFLEACEWGLAYSVSLC